MKKKYRLYLYWTLFICHLSFIFFLSSLHKSPEFPKLLDAYNLDKLVHIGLYSVLGYLFAQVTRRSFNWNSSRLLLLLALVFGTFYGLSDEFHQYFVPTRSVSLGDVLADSIGTLLGAFVYIQIMRKRNRAYAQD